MKLSKLAIGLVAIVAIAITSQKSVSAASSTDKVRVVEVGSNDLIVLNGEVNGESTSRVIEAARKMDGKFSFGSAKPIYLFLNTPGGSVQSGAELIEVLKGLKRPVKTITMFAASMGFQIAQGLGSRYIMNSGTLMSHHATGGMEGQFGGSLPNQLGNRIGWLEAQIKEFDMLTVRRTNGKQTLESYTKAYDHELWLTAPAAVAGGYADEIVQVRCNSSLDGYTTHEVSFMGMGFEFDLSNCPLNTSPVHVKIKIDSNLGRMDYDTFINKGGKFGSNCQTSNSFILVPLCSYDTSLTPERVAQIKTQFVQHFYTAQSSVIDRP